MQTTVRVGVQRIVLGCWSQLQQSDTQLAEPWVNENFPTFNCLYSQPRRLTHFFSAGTFHCLPQAAKPQKKTGIDISCRRRQMNKPPGCWIFILSWALSAISAFTSLLFLEAGARLSPQSHCLLFQNSVKLWVGVSHLSLRIPQYHIAT